MTKTPPPLPEDERIGRLRLARTKNVGPIAFNQLLARYGSAAAAIEDLPRLARRGGRVRPPQVYAYEFAIAELEAIAQLGGRLVVRGDSDYPAPLAATDDAPPAITIMGDGDLLGRRTIAVVGARNASANGRRFAGRLAHDLGECGFAVVSGLARGIDAAAHEGALETGTIAVIAGGLDVFYPKENRPLQEAIGRRGVVVAENPLGTEPKARHFPRRNRIISGLSLGIVVVEAALRSGSLITARLAGEQGREVFAVPGSPLDPRAKGTNNLIRQGAVLTESAQDVVDVLDQMLGGPFRELPSTVGLTPSPGTETGDNGDVDHRMILEALGPSPISIDELIRHCALSSSAMATALLELELAGRIDRLPGNRVALAL
ncbi:MAG: DNA-protecting protein DprA [Alphaproteobacteria bacterium]|nr:DNA-protecting protein DprA [Alphaproteobacteria bacterium]